jgi:hypothetical protein
MATVKLIGCFFSLCRDEARGKKDQRDIVLGGGGTLSHGSLLCAGAGCCSGAVPGHGSSFCSPLP